MLIVCIFFNPNQLLLRTDNSVEFFCKYTTCYLSYKECHVFNHCQRVNIFLQVIRIIVRYQ